jgi:hypothetical protein
MIPATSGPAGNLNEKLVDWFWVMEVYVGNTKEGFILYFCRLMLNNFTNRSK